ncbi:cobalamin binding intrinsic factor-like isoform X2 [Paralichthys olivaceus]
MALSSTALFSVGFLLLLPQGTLMSKGPESLPIILTVENDLSNMTPETYSSSVVEGGVLLGALRRLQETQQDFKFTVKEDPDFGLMLESVNGVAGSEREQTYWEILSGGSGDYSRLDVGIGCYKPTANEHIILRFSMWPQHV